MTTAPEAEMTWRARFYLSVATCRYAALGLVALVVDYQWGGVDAGLSITGWGVVFVAEALLLLFAATRGSEKAARLGLALSSIVTGVWAAAFWVLATSSDGPTGILLAITFTSLTLKDLTIVGDPMRSPFEPIIKEYMAEGRG